MIDVAIGLVFFYVALSLVCSSIQEIVAGVFGLRARNLRRGIVNLVGDEYARALYQHPLVKGLRKPGRLPSYLNADIFATALIEVVAQAKAGKPAFELSGKELREMIARIDPYNPTRGVLLGLLDAADSRVGKLKRRIAEWFDAAMERVAGWYKRQVTWFLLALATVVTLAVNADTIRIAEQLWRDAALRGAVAVAAEEAVAAGDLGRLDERAELDTFPLGYPEGFPGSAGITFRMIVGWLLTVSAVSLGAPFWFDLLGKVARLRAAGRVRGHRASP
jgi:hypothetical protein